MEQKMKVNVTAAEVGHKTCNCCRRFLKTYHSASAWKNTDDIKDKSETNFQERLCSECLCGSNDWILLQNEASEICIKSWSSLFEWPHINNNISTQRSKVWKGQIWDLREEANFSWRFPLSDSWSELTALHQKDFWVSRSWASRSIKGLWR